MSAARRRPPTLPRRLTGDSPKGAQLREILEGLLTVLPPGSALPSERELAERYGVARMTVRGELDRLAGDGLAYRVQGRGTFVAEPRVAQAKALTSFTEDMRARGLEPSSRLLAREEHPAGGRMARRLELRPSAPLVRVDRLRLADAEPLAVEQVTLPLERFPEAATADLGATSLFELLEERWGARPAEADQRVLAVAIAGRRRPSCWASRPAIPGCASSRWRATPTGSRCTSPCRCSGATGTRSSCARSGPREHAHGRRHGRPARGAAGAGRPPRGGAGAPSPALGPAAGHDHRRPRLVRLRGGVRPLRARGRHRAPGGPGRPQPDHALRRGDRSRRAGWPWGSASRAARRRSCPCSSATAPPVR